MIQRLFARLIDVLVIGLVLSFVAGFFAGLCRHGIGAVLTTIARPSTSFFASAGVLLLTSAFLVGLVVRTRRWMSGSGGRDRENRDRQVRLTVRRLAEDMPVVATPEPPDDPDPALGMEED